MIEDIFFQDEGQVKITAASVGISKLQWTSIKEEEIETNKHLKLMEVNRFDHLPIESPKGIITEYFKTIEPNRFEKIERHKIKFNDIIPLDTNIKDVIEKFASENRSFFFLRYQKTISGLITIGNLNCKQVQVYIFSLICELERGLGNFLNSNLESSEIKEWTENKTIEGKFKNKYRNILNKYNDLLREDLENSLTEHFFLIDFFSIYRDKNLYKKLDYTLEEWNEIQNINNLRNKIAHPTKSLLDKETDIKKIKKQITQVEDLTFRLSK
jgi:hypothetical protein